MSKPTKEEKQQWLDQVVSIANEIDVEDKWEFICEKRNVIVDRKVCT